MYLVCLVMGRKRVCKFTYTVCKSVKSVSEVELNRKPLEHHELKHHVKKITVSGIQEMCYTQ